MQNRTMLSSQKAREWLKLIALVILLITLIVAANLSYASDGAEFQDAANKFENWIKGNLGKMAAFVALAVGAIMAAVKKDWTWFMGAVVLSVGMGILIGIVNASFTATI